MGVRSRQDLRLRLTEKEQSAEQEEGHLQGCQQDEHDQLFGSSHVLLQRQPQEQGRVAEGVDQGDPLHGPKGDDAQQ